MGIFPPRSVIEIANIKVGMGVKAYVGTGFTDSDIDFKSKTTLIG